MARAYARKHGYTGIVKDRNLIAGGSIITVGVFSVLVIMGFSKWAAEPLVKPLVKPLVEPTVEPDLESVAEPVIFWPEVDRSIRAARATTEPVEDPNQVDYNGLVLLKNTVSGRSDGDFATITGTVVNRTGRKLRYVQIIFNMYDKSGAQVGNAIDNLNGFESGGRWNFKATAFGSKTAHYGFSELSGF